MNIYQRIQELAKARKISIRQLEHDLEFSNGTVRKWETSAPTQRLTEVANYFNVSVDDLLGANKLNNVQTNSQIVEGLFRKVSDEYDLTSQEKKELQEDFSDYLALRAKRLRERRRKNDKN